MSDDANGTFIGTRAGFRREREHSGIEPFLTLRYQRRGRSISRVVAIPLAARGDGSAPVLEIFFGLG
jgi:hypothetical protein